MKVEREKFLNDLNMVRAGLSPKEFIEQSSCLVFQDGQVMTFNDEIACRKDIGINITGAVQASSLMAILEKLTDDELKVRENENNELEFRGKNKGFGVTKDGDIYLPINKVEMPKKWTPLAPSFTHAMGLVEHCVSTDESRFELCCIHITTKFVEACDNFQIMRCNVPTGITEDVLVRGTSMKHITAMEMDEIALTENWIHFRNKSGLVFSCRKYSGDYPNVDKMIVMEGDRITIPKGLVDASDRAMIFAMDKSGDPLVKVSVSNNVLRILGEGLSGWYKEVKKTTYKGPPLEFVIAPYLLRHIAEKYTDATINESKLKVTSDDKHEKWQYITSLGKPEVEEPEEEEPEDEEEEEEQPKRKKRSEA